MSKRTRTCDVIAPPTDSPIVGMNRLERVIWLQHHGVTDGRILDALFDPADPELERFAIELATGLNTQGFTDG